MIDKLNSYKIHYRKIGSSAKTLVFVHGLMGYWRNFYHVSQAFKQDYTCILYSQRGHGLSFHQKPWTIKELAGDLHQLLQHLNLKKPITLLGHSLGAYVSCYFAYQYPDSLNQLIMLDASPWPKKEKAKEIVQLLNFLPQQFESQSHARSFFKKAVLEGQLSKAMAQFIRASLEKKDKKPQFLFNKEALLSLLSSVRTLDYPQLLSAISCPILYLRGENSTHFLSSELKTVARLNPKIQPAEIAKSGHWIHAEQPLAFIQTVKNFLKA